MKRLILPLVLCLGSTPACAADTAPPTPPALPAGMEIKQRADVSSIGAFVTITADGTKALATDDHGRVFTWDLKSGRLLQSLSLGEDPDFSYNAFSADGSQLISGSLTEDHYRLWDLHTGKLVREVKTQDRTNGLAFSPNGRWVATSSGDDFGHGDLVEFHQTDPQLWSTASGRPVKRFHVTKDKYGDGQNVVAFSPDGRMLASGGTDATIRLWDVASGKPIRTFEAVSDGNVQSQIGTLSFSPDNHRLLSSNDFAGPVVWDIDSGKAVWRFKTDENAETAPVLASAFSPDSRSLLLASGSALKLVDLQNGALTPLPRDAELKTLDFLRFLPDGKIILAHDNNTLILLNASSGKTLARFFANDKGWATLAADGSFVASGDLGDFIELRRGQDAAPIDDFIKANRRDKLDLAL